MINIRKLNVCYMNGDKHIKVMENINLGVDKGEICALIGPSGVGKSTLLKVLSGIIKGYDGEVTIDKKVVNPKIHRIGFIPQNYGLVRWKSVEENIYLSTKIKDGKKHIDRELYEVLLNKLQIKDLIKKYPDQLSGGQKQRVSIARAFLLKPKLLLMDEPFSALDAMTREKVQQLFLEIWRENKVTTIFVTHDINEAIYLGKKIVVLTSTPGKITKVFNNDLFGHSYKSQSHEYGELNKTIRKAIDIEEDRN